MDDLSELKYPQSMKFVIFYVLQSEIFVLFDKVVTEVGVGAGIQIVETHSIRSD